MDWATKGVDARRSNARRVRLAKTIASLRADVSFAAVDALLVAMAYTVALVLRFLDLPQGVPDHWWQDFVLFLPVIICVHLLANVLFGTYGHVWEFASIAEAMKIALASASAALVLFSGVMVSRLVFDLVGPIPIGTLALGSLLTLTLTEAVRFRSRLFSFNRVAAGYGGAPHRRILVVGVGRPAADLVRQLRASDEPHQVIGFVSPDLAEVNRRLAGLPVLGTLDSVPELVGAHDVTEVIVANANGSNLARRLVDLCLSIDVRLRIVPDVGSIMADQAAIQDVRDLQPDDLLERSSVHTDLAQVGSVLDGTVVLVTGAGGSIGSELVRQILSFKPSRVLVLDHDETHLHEALLRWGPTEIPLEPILCDIRDLTRVQRVFEAHRPKVIFHAAAHKHVPMLESSPEEAVKTNILGTLYLIEAGRRVGVERFVLISTDKAAAPVGIMGASKRVAEMLVQSAAPYANGCLYTAVRFGNVLGSRGSVVPTFVEQIQRGGPVTVTDPEMTRYFMTTSEAVELVLQGAAIAKPGQVLVLDMGEPVKIIDLAHRLIRMAGMVPGRDVKVQITGRRPGEKLSEVLSTVPLGPSDHPRISVADQGWPGPVTLLDTIQLLIKLAAAGNAAAVSELLLDTARRDWQPDELVDLEETEEVLLG